MSEKEQNVHHETDVTYGDIVWGQFRKNTTAFVSLCLLGSLFLLAMICPLLANDNPFIWTENGETFYPWFSSLFDQNYFPNAIDLFFNLLFVFGIPLLFLWIGISKILAKRKIAKRPRRKLQRKIAAILLLVFAGVFLYILENPYKEPKKQYLAISEDYNVEQRLAGLIAQQESVLSLQSELPETEQQAEINALQEKALALQGESKELHQQSLSAQSAVNDAFNLTTFAPVVENQSILLDEYRSNHKALKAFGAGLAEPKQAAELESKPIVVTIAQGKEYITWVILLAILVLLFVPFGERQKQRKFLLYALGILICGRLGLSFVATDKTYLPDIIGQLESGNDYLTKSMEFTKTVIDKNKEAIAVQKSANEAQILALQKYDLAYQTQQQTLQKHLQAFALSPASQKGQQTLQQEIDNTLTDLQALSKLQKSAARELVNQYKDNSYIFDEGVQRKLKNAIRTQKAATTAAKKSVDIQEELQSAQQLAISPTGTTIIEAQRKADQKLAVMKKQFAATIDTQQAAIEVQQEAFGSLQKAKTESTDEAAEQKEEKPNPIASIYDEMIPLLGKLQKQMKTINSAQEMLFATPTEKKQIEVFDQYQDILTEMETFVDQQKKIVKAQTIILNSHQQAAEIIDFSNQIETTISLQTALLDVLKQSDITSKEVASKIQESVKQQAVSIKKNAEVQQTQQNAISNRRKTIIQVQGSFPVIPYGYNNNTFNSVEAPNAKHWLGTDQSKRDVSVRMLYGIRIALSIGVIAVGIYVTIGIIVGSMAGFFRGWVDLLVVRVIEIFMCIPSLIVILVIIALLQANGKNTSIFHLMLVLGGLRWTGVARLIRGEFLRLRNQDFVTSAIALGYSRSRIIFQHILPNALGPVLVAATFGVAAAILVESTLSFLGLGDTTIPSWGQTIAEGYATQAWHLILAPGFAIFITVSLLNLVGEGIRDAIDPKMRK